VPFMSTNQSDGTVVLLVLLLFTPGVPSSEHPAIRTATMAAELMRSRVDMVSPLIE